MRRIAARNRPASITVPELERYSGWRLDEESTDRLSAGLDGNGVWRCERGHGSPKLAIGVAVALGFVGHSNPDGITRGESKEVAYSCGQLYRHPQVPPTDHRVL